MPVFINYSNAIFGTQSTVNESGYTYNSSPPPGSSWSWSGSTTSFTLRENDGAQNFNGDGTSFFDDDVVAPQEQFGGTWEQVVNIGGNYYQTIYDYTFAIRAPDGTILTVSVIDVDLNNDNDLYDFG